MNGFGARKPVNGFGAAHKPAMAPMMGPPPGGRALVEGYRKDIVTGFEKEKPRYNPMNPERVQSSVLVDLKDPIQVHLLTETALLDSKEYEILSEQEADDLKRQCISLRQRIEQTRANLAIQSKYRDAAISMAKLYSPNSTGGAPSGKRRSLLGNRLSGGDANAREAEAERQASERRCEELASELWALEKRLMEPQRRLLEHTAGILQMTHGKAAAARNGTPPSGLMVNGIPGSPESMYTGSGGRNSVEPAHDEDVFDDRSQYQPLDQLDSFDDQGRGPMGIPERSPARGQANQLKEQVDRLTEEKSRLEEDSQQLRAESNRLNFEVNGLRSEAAQWSSSISDAERRLGELGNQLRDVIIAANPSKNARYQSPPYALTNGTDRAIEPGDLIGSQLAYFQNGISKLKQDLVQRESESTREAEGAVAAIRAQMERAEDRLESTNRQLHDLLQRTDERSVPPPEVSGSGLDDQVAYFERSLDQIESEFSRASSMATARQQSDESSAVLEGLWDLIQSGQADAQRRREIRQRARAEKGLADDDDEFSGDEEGFDAGEQYSLSAFNSKIQQLYRQATGLKDQKSVLKRQIKQQRELNSKSDSEKDKEAARKEEEIRGLRDELDHVEDDAADTRKKLTKALADLDKAESARMASESADVKQAQAQLKEQTAKTASLEDSVKDLRSKLDNAEASVAAVKAELETAKRTGVESAETAAKSKAKDDELDSLNHMVAELKMEVAIARAELDGAYGSRKERAAEAAALAGTSESAGLQAQVDKLRSELSSTLGEFEVLTKETIGAEKEKLALEARLDEAESERARLRVETRQLKDKLDAEARALEDAGKKVARLQEELDGEKLRAGPLSAGSGAPGSGGRPGAGASMLSEQFRATMREERRRFQEDLREEQNKRRKLEDEVRALKRAQGPGKSPLSPR